MASRLFGQARRAGFVLLASVLCATTSQAQPRAAAVDDERLLNADLERGQWLSYGRTYNEQRFSPLDQINDGNISELGLAWFLDLPTNQNVETTPLFIDGVLYLTLPWSEVQAIDARTGRVIWHYDPQVPGDWNINVCCGLDNRGAAAWNGKIIIGTLDGRLIALDAATGSEVWSVKATPEGRYSITGAPRVAKGKVFIGSAGGEFDVRGHIDAYDAETGAFLWRFWTVPGNPALGFEDATQEMAARTWVTPGWWEKGPGGTVWDAITYDPETNLVIFGTGNGAPWDAVDRDSGGGDNLFISSIVALNADTGEYVWHYQETPGDSWDYDAVSPMMVADLDFNGQERRVIVHPSKNGFIYVLDAATGAFISGDAFTGVTWALGIDASGRPIEAPGARYETEPFNIGPGAPGGHTWHPNAFSPLTGLVYIPTWENYSAMTPQVRPEEGPPPLIAFGGRVDRATLKPHNKEANDGWLQAWDPVRREVVWESERGPRWTSGVLATAGNLVFMGNSNGNTLSAFNAETGEVLWSYDTQSAVYAAPITYELDGEQYIAASVGGTSPGDYYAPSYGRMLVFKVGGDVRLPPQISYTPPELNPPASTATAAVIARGAEVYSEHCSVCHGTNGVQQRSSFPNLTLSPLLHVQAGFDQVVLQGGRVARGMANFSDRLSAEDSVAIREFIIARANEIKNAPPSPGFAPPPPPDPDADVHEEAAEN